ncbi:PREDICTED: uncharacterized protein LOC105542835 [Mandrillus leucophaeus]|uniref:uncharacterized protein LOC105542835 n=1 Tax=Mandrillus leucophaeus TaxID=9568 RepID=UPI0005F53C7A|nr:PREDICTED: uncharacterized protein LOC105542835 [Mandrillus leucophaeus]
MTQSKQPTSTRKQPTSTPSRMLPGMGGPGFCSGPRVSAESFNVGDITSSSSCLPQNLMSRLKGGCQGIRSSQGQAFLSASYPPVALQWRRFLNGCIGPAHHPTATLPALYCPGFGTGLREKPELAHPVASGAVFPAPPQGFPVSAKPVPQPGFHVSFASVWELCACVRVFVEEGSFLSNGLRKEKECSLQPPGSLGQGYGPRRTVCGAGQLVASTRNSRDPVTPTSSLPCPQYLVLYTKDDLAHLPPRDTTVTRSSVSL